LIELEEKGFGWDLGYRPSSKKEFLLAPIHPPLVAFSDPSKGMVGLTHGGLHPRFRGEDNIGLAPDLHLRHLT
jgi:hypothetical protein